MLTPLYLRRQFSNSVNEVVVVRLHDSHLLGSEKARLLGECLWAVVEKGECCQLVLSCGPVVAADSILLAEIIRLHKRVFARGGRLVLCQLSPQLYDMLHFLQLTRLLTIRPTEREALGLLTQTPEEDESSGRTLPEHQLVAC